MPKVQDKIEELRDEIKKVKEVVKEKAETTSGNEQLFWVKRQNNPKCPILLCTPLWDYGLSIEDFKKVRNEILEFDIDGN